MRFDQHIMQFWSPDGGTGANGGDTSGGNGGQGAGNAGDGGRGNASDEPAWLPKRLERAQKAGRDALLVELGIAPDEVGTLKDALQKQAAGRSELETLTRKHQQLEKDHATTKAEADSLRGQLRQINLSAAVESALGESGFAVNDQRLLTLLLTDSRSSTHLGYDADGEMSVFEDGKPARGKKPVDLVKSFLGAKGREYLLRPVGDGGGQVSRAASGAEGDQSTKEPPKNESPAQRNRRLIEEAKAELRAKKDK